MRFFSPSSLILHFFGLLSLSTLQGVTLSANTFLGAGDASDLSIQEEFNTSFFNQNNTAGLGVNVGANSDLTSADSFIDLEGMDFSGRAQASATYGNGAQQVVVSNPSIPPSLIGWHNANFPRRTYSLLGPVLRTFASGGLTTIVSNSSYDPGDVDSGVPNYYVSWAEAEFSDQLRYGIPQSGTIYDSTYYFHVSGSIAGAGAFILLELTHGTAPSQDFIFFAEGNYDFVIASEAVRHGTTNQNIQLRLLSSFQVSTDDPSMDGTDISGNASFESTVGLLGIELRDENGNLAAPGTITNSDGLNYTIVVPEPSTALLGLSALLPLALRRRH